MIDLFCISKIFVFNWLYSGQTSCHLWHISCSQLFRFPNKCVLKSSRRTFGNSEVRAQWHFRAFILSGVNKWKYTLNNSCAWKRLDIIAPVTNWCNKSFFKIIFWHHQRVETYPWFNLTEWTFSDILIGGKNEILNQKEKKKEDLF